MVLIIQSIVLKLPAFSNHLESCSEAFQVREIGLLNEHKVLFVVTDGQPIVQPFVVDLDQNRFEPDDRFTIAGKAGFQTALSQNKKALALILTLETQPTIVVVKQNNDQPMMLQLQVDQLADFHSGDLKFALNHDGTLLAVNTSFTLQDSIAVFDVNTGQRLWQHQISRKLAFVDFLSDDSVIFMTSDCVVMRLRTRDGSQIWLNKFS